MVLIGALDLGDLKSQPFVAVTSIYWILEIAVTAEDMGIFDQLLHGNFGLVDIWWDMLFDGMNVPHRISINLHVDTHLQHQIPTLYLVVLPAFAKSSLNFVYADGRYEFSSKLS